jgi:hypothetical protein
MLLQQSVLRTSGRGSMKKRGMLGTFAIAALVLGALGATAAAAGPDREVTGSLQGTNVIISAGPGPTFFPLVVDEDATMTLSLQPGPTVTGSYSLDYTRTDNNTATGTFTFTGKGATLTGSIASSNFVTCTPETGSLLCFDAVISPLTVTGHGPLGRFEGGTLTLRRDIFAGADLAHRTVTGDVEGNLCGTSPTC